MYNCKTCQYPISRTFGDCPKCGLKNRPHSVAVLEYNPTLPTIKTYQLSTLAGRSDVVLRNSNRFVEQRALEICRRGYKNGPNEQALFNDPKGIAIDSKGNIYVSDTLNHCIRKITPTGRVSTFAGEGSRGFLNGRAKKAKFNSPTGITIDHRGYVYVIDSFNFCVRKISPAGKVSQLHSPGKPQGSIAVDQNGNLFYHALIQIYQRELSCICKLDREQKLYLLVHHQEEYRWVLFEEGDDTHPLGNWSPERENPLIPVSFKSTKENLALAINQSNEVFASDGHKIFKINKDGVQHVAGTVPGYVDGHANRAQFNGIKGLTLDRENNLYVADSLNHSIRKITPDGTVTTLTNYRNSSMPLNQPSGVAVDATGNIFITDTGNWRVCQLLLSEKQEILDHPLMILAKLHHPLIKGLRHYKGQIMDSIQSVLSKMRTQAEDQSAFLPETSPQFEDIFVQGSRTQQLSTAQQFISSCKNSETLVLYSVQSLFAHLLNSKEVSVRAMLLRESSYLMKSEKDALMWVNLLANYQDSNRLMRKYKVKILDYIGTTYQLYGNTIPLIVDCIRDREEEIQDYALELLMKIRNMGYESLIDPLMEEIAR